MKKYVLWVTLAVLTVGVVLGALAIAGNREPEQPAGEQSGSAPDFTVLDAQGNLTPEEIKAPPAPKRRFR